MLRKFIFLVLFVGLPILCVASPTSSRARVAQNPLIRSNSPDPGGLVLDDKIFVATTSGDAPNHFPIHSTPISDFQNWKLEGHAFPEKGEGNPKWATSDFWAPEIHHIKGQFVLVFAARTAAGILAVGAAKSKGGVEGPYFDVGEPIVVNSTMGNIDPTLFFDKEADKLYLIWKEDGNAVGKPTPIWIQEISVDTLKLAAGSERKMILTDSLPWEYNLVEAPYIVKKHQNKKNAAGTNGDTFFLFYSAAGYASDKYAIGVARSETLFGPYEKHPDPILHSATNHNNNNNNGKNLTDVDKTEVYFSGPGHCCVLRAPDGRDFMLYHAWFESEIGGDFPRMMLFDNIIYTDDDWVAVGKGQIPSTTAQPVP